MPKKFLIIICILFGGFNLGGFSYAQNASCPTCNIAPQELDNYIKTMQNNVGKVLYVSPEQESDNTVTNAARATRNVLNQAQVMLLLSEILFSAPGDIWSDFKNIVKTVPQKRDRDSLLSIDQKISDATLALIQQSDYNKPVSTGAAQRLDTMFKEMGGWIVLKKDNDGNYNIVSQKTTYRELAKFLWGLNMFIKHNHSRRWYTQFLEEVGKNANITLYGPNQAMEKQQKVDAEALKKVFEKTDWRRDFLVKATVTQNKQRSTAQERLQLDPEKTIFWIRRIEQQYQCADGLKNQCNELKRVRQENRKLTKDMIVNNSKSAVTTIIDATRRLGALMHIGSDKDIETVNQRKRALLHSQRGSETDRRLESGYVNKLMQGTSALWKRITNSEKKAQDPVNGGSANERMGADTPAGSKDVWGHPDPLTYEKPEQMLDFIKSVKESLDKEPKSIDGSNAFNAQDYQKGTNIALRKDLIHQSIQGVLSQQDALAEQSVFHDPHSVTLNFPTLSRKVYENINTIGRKNQENSLVDNMGNVCELQCTNLQGRCWYIED